VKRWSTVSRSHVYQPSLAEHVVAVDVRQSRAFCNGQEARHCRTPLNSALGSKLSETIMSNHKLLTTSLMLCLLLMAGCAQMAVDRRLKEYQALFDPMIGKATQTDIVRQFGAPLARQTIGALEMWTYHQLFGTRGGAYVSPYNQYGTYAAGQAHEVYDRLTLTFDGAGVLESWRAYVQR